jgi:hypothetical protein
MEVIDWIDGLYGTRSGNFGYTRDEIANVLDIYFDRKDPELCWDGTDIIDRKVILALLKKNYDFCYIAE